MMDAGPIRVLLVEDDDDDYFLTRSLFEEISSGEYVLERVANYADAARTLGQCDHDLYLVDYRLGEHTGLELLAEAQRQNCRCPMIMLTGQRERELDLSAMRAGAADYLVQDELTASSLERAMRYAMQKRRYDAEIRAANQQLEERVQLRTLELAQANQSLQNEIAERKRAEEALRQADRRKDEFLATLAHELRNPLTPLVGALQLIELQPDDVEQVRQLRQMMGRQVEQLVRLIDDLLDVSRISRGKLNLRRERILFQDVIHSALEISRPAMVAGEHAFTLSVPDQPLPVFGDQVRLAQVVSNLLINAAKYTPEQGRIELQAQAEPHEIVVRVRDNGIGIPTAMLPRVFDLFTQVDGSATRSHGGLGIGLTIAKTLTEMHGGTLVATSDGPGLGTTFTLRLPRADAASLSDGALTDTPSDATPAPAPLPVRRIMVVDDNEAAGYLLSRLLQKLGQNVCIVHSATAALLNIPSLQPDIIISDIAMPGMSGYELAQEVRKRIDLHQPVLIALTGFGQDTDRQRSLDAGFDHHLTKPVGIQALEVLLRAV